MELKSILNTVTSAEYSALFYTPGLYHKPVSYLFIDPEESVIIDSRSSADRKLKEIDQLIKDGYSAYALIKYEAGYLFERKLFSLLPEKDKLVQFYFCKPRNVLKIDSDSLSVQGVPGNYRIKNFRLNTSKKEFSSNIKTIKEYIARGETYQVNYTVKGKFRFSGDIADLFIQLLYNQSAQYSSLINSGGEFLVSLSPELFFRIDGGSIYAKPMKGTARRGYDLQSDGMTKFNLSTSEKNRAENVMIVDLLRNDLGRISRFDSVKVKDLFQVEKYESLFQMVTGIEAELRKRISLTEVLKNIFPCGSITGAPKIRTMQIINEIEKESRGIYTGAIGFVHKKKKVFNVAIRTLIIDKQSGKGEIGLGSGIVWDSNAEHEYQETLLKSRFLTKPGSEFELFETMLLSEGKIDLLDDHLERLGLSASYFLFSFDEDKIKAELEKRISEIGHRHKFRLKLYLNKFGKVRTEFAPFISPPDSVKIILSKSRVNSYNKYQYFKTTIRKLYDREYQYFRKRGFYDVIYFNEKSELAEGSISNIFLRLGDSYFTPAVNSGILAGVFRKNLLRSDPGILERTLHLDDLLSADEVFLTNALKGKVNVDFLYLNETEFKALK